MPRLARLIAKYRSQARLTKAPRSKRRAEQRVGRSFARRFRRLGAGQRCKLPVPAYERSAALLAHEQKDLEVLEQRLGLVPKLLRRLERPEVLLRLCQVPRRTRSSFLQSAPPHLPLGQPHIHPPQLGRRQARLHAVRQRAAVVRRRGLALPERGVQLADPERDVGAVARFRGEERALVGADRVGYPATRAEIVSPLSRGRSSAHGLGSRAQPSGTGGQDEAKRSSHPTHRLSFS